MAPHEPPLPATEPERGEPENPAAGGDDHSWGARLVRAKRDPEQYGLFVDAAQRRVFTYFHLQACAGLWWVDIETAVEDMVQETFRKVLEALDTYKPTPTASGEAWVFTIARNTFRDRRRAERRRLVRASPDEGGVEVPDPSPGADHQLEVKETVERVRRWLGRLPAGDRELILLKEFVGLTFQQIIDLGLVTSISALHRRIETIHETLRGFGNPVETGG